MYAELLPSPISSADKALGPLVSPPPSSPKASSVVTHCDLLFEKTLVKYHCLYYG